jgi:Arc/MetJ family transcription regulator
MRTNIVIDDGLLADAFSVSEARTKKDLVHEALRELVRLRKRKDLTELAGKIQFHKGFDQKKLRKIRG